MSVKKVVLLSAMKEMKKLAKFQDNTHDLLKLDVYELQPSITAGVLFDLLTGQLLNDEGNDLLNEFMFGGYYGDYGENNPFVITKEENDGFSVKYEIRTCEAMCDFLENNDYFRG